MSVGKTVPDMSSIRGYKEVILTGGEPMLNPARVIEYAKQARENNPGCKVYLYTALWKNEMYDVIEYLDGVHFTVHNPCSDEDYDGFLAMQELARDNKGKSFRLHIFPENDWFFQIHPAAWNRVDFKPWLVDCPIPDNEDFYILSAE